MLNVDYLFSKATRMDDLPKDNYLEMYPVFRLANHRELNLRKAAKAKAFFWILNEQSYQSLPTGQNSGTGNLTWKRRNGEVFDCGDFVSSFSRHLVIWL